MHAVKEPSAWSSPASTALHVSYQSTVHALINLLKTVPPQVLLGDILSDLPPVDNFCVRDKCDYACDPQHPVQAWLRRQPMPWSTSARARQALHDSYNSGGERLNRLLLNKASKPGGIEEVGRCLCAVRVDPGPASGSLVSTLQRGAKLGSSMACHR